MSKSGRLGEKVDCFISERCFVRVCMGLYKCE